MYVITMTKNNYLGAVFQNILQCTHNCICRYSEGWGGFGAIVGSQRYRRIPRSIVYFLVCTHSQPIKEAYILVYRM